MTQRQMEPLEGRRLMADVSVVLASKTLADTLTAGAALKSPALVYTVAASGTQSKTEGKAKLVLNVALRPAAGGADLATGSAKITASSIAKKPKAAKISFSKLKVAPAAGSYVVVATLTGQGTAGDGNASNDSTSTAITVTAAPTGSGSSSPFAITGLQGNMFTFTRTARQGLGSIGREQGNLKTNAGSTATYDFTFGTGSTAVGGFISVNGGAPFVLQFHPNSGTISSFAGKKFTFGVTQAESKGFVEFSGATIYFR